MSRRNRSKTNLLLLPHHDRDRIVGVVLSVSGTKIAANRYFVLPRGLRRQQVVGYLARLLHSSARCHSSRSSRSRAAAAACGP
jgi:hypothetical protein